MISSRSGRPSHIYRVQMLPRSVAGGKEEKAMDRKRTLKRGMVIGALVALAALVARYMWQKRSKRRI